MADLININNNATEVVAALDDYGDFSVDMTATQFVGEVNNAFDTDVDVDDTATELVEAINAAADSPVVPVTPPDPIKFLHYSDPHGTSQADPSNPNQAVTTAKAVKVMTDSTDTDYDAGVAFAILTGDNADNGFYSGMRTALINAKTTTGKHLVMMGNHDINDVNTGYNRDHVAMAAALRDYNTDVVYGGDTCAYWYKSFPLSNGGKLYLIATDEYDISSVDAGFGNTTVFTQAQIDWFIGLLDNVLTSKDYFIVATHKYPVSYSLVSGGIKQYRARNKFTSSWLYDWDALTAGQEDNMGIFADIIHAYQTGGTFSKSYRSYNRNPSNTVNIDWSNKVGKATFICFLCGHLHGDFCGPHPIHTDQLVLDIDTAKKAVSAYTDSGERDQSDIQSSARTSAGGYLMNKVTVDFEHHRLTIDRIGAKQTTARTVDSSTYPNDAGDTQGKEYPAVTRDTITFDYTTAQVVESEASNDND